MGQLQTGRILRWVLVGALSGGLLILPSPDGRSWTTLAGHAVLVVGLAVLALRGSGRERGQDSGSKETPSDRTVLFQCLEDVHAEVASSARDCGVHLQVDYLTPMPVTIEADGSLLRSALADVLQTAIHATRQGTVLLLAYCWREEGQMRLELVTLDAGTGLQPAELRRMFDDWTGLDTAADVERLTRATRTMQALNGQLEIGRWPGIGTVYRVEAPVGSDEGVTFFRPPERPQTEEPMAPPIIAPRPADDAPAAPAAPAALAPSPSPTAASPTESLVGLRILVVDDLPVNRLLLEKILAKRGAEVTLAENGRKGAEQCGKATESGRPFDAILMDIHMPEMDGYEATSRIRASGYRNPILAVTADAALGGREAFLRRGFDEHVAKPIDKPFLVGRIRSLCGMEDTPTEPASPAETDRRA